MAGVFRAAKVIHNMETVKIIMDNYFLTLMRMIIGGNNMG